MAISMAATATYNWIAVYSDTNDLLDGGTGSDDICEGDAGDVFLNCEHIMAFKVPTRSRSALTGAELVARLPRPFVLPLFTEAPRKRSSRKFDYTEFRKRLGSLLEPSEGVSETLGGVGCCGEIAVGCRHLELLDLGVDADEIGTIQGVQDTVSDVADGKDIAADCARVPRRRVQRELSGPEVEAGKVDLDRRSVAQLEVEAPLGGVDRCLLGLRGVAGVDRSGEGREGVGHPGLDHLRHFARLVGLPGCGHLLDRGRSRVPVSGVGRVEDAKRAAIEVTELGRCGLGRHVGGHREGEGLDVASACRVELAVAGGEGLVLGGPVHVELLGDEPAVNGAQRSVERLVGGLDGYLFERD